MAEYEVSPFTEAVWRKGLVEAPGLGLYVRETGKEGAQFGLEVFGRLANASTTVYRGDGPEWAKVAHEKVEALPAFARAKALLGHLPMHAALNQFAGSTLDALRPYVQSVGEHQRAPQSPNKAPTTAQDALKALLEAVDAAVEPENFKPKSAEEAAVASVQDVAEALDHAAQNAGTLLSALHGAGCDLSEMSGRGSEDGQVVEEVMSQLAQSPDLLEIMELAGRWRTIARALAKSEPREGVGRVVGVEYGNDLTRMLPEAAVSFVDPELEVLFLLDYVQGSLALDKLRTEEAKIAGPLCIMLDLSGSMEEAKRHVFAKAVCLAIVEVALDQGRPVLVLPFSSGTRGVYTWTRALDPQTAVSFAKLPPDGGTNFAAPWLAFRDAVETSSWAGAEQADVVMITDGRASTSTPIEIRDHLRATFPQLTTYGFLFGSQTGEQHMAGLVDEGCCVHVEELAAKAMDAMKMLVRATI